jgi:hypothetical protein
LEQDAYIDSSADLVTNNVYIPIIGYLLENEKFPNESIKQGFIYWMHLAHIWGRYSGQTDQRLDRDVSLATTYKNPIQYMVNEIEDQRGRITIRPTDLEGRSSRHPLHRMLYTMTKWKQGTDWETGGALRNTKGDYYSVQSHHIFPQSFLYEEGPYDANNHLDRKKVNEIANRAFITRESNYQISDTPPSKYLPDKNKSMLKKHLIPTESKLWELKNYELFLETRRKIIADAMNQFLDEYKDKWEGADGARMDYKTLITKGENNYVEFKELMRWSHLKDKPDKESEHVIAKTLAGFMNSEGGVLFIGVDDEGKIKGLEKDYETLGNKKNKDGFLLQFDNLIDNLIGREFNAFLYPEIINFKGKEICVVEALESSRPVFVNDDEFYIRAAASTQKLSGREQTEYIKDHWQ